MDKRLKGLLAQNPEAAKSSDKIKAALQLIKRLRESGLSEEGYRLATPAGAKKGVVPVVRGAARRYGWKLKLT